MFLPFVFSQRFLSPFDKKCLAMDLRCILNRDGDRIVQIDANIKYVSIHTKLVALSIVDDDSPGLEHILV